MSERISDDVVNRELLSALADGQANADEVSRASAAWRHQAEARATWHAYHLIGETMRSPQAASASDSAAFLQRMRVRLAQEPVVLSPQSAQLVGRAGAEAGAESGAAQAPSVQPLKRRMWAGPVAVAASFALIVGVLVSNLGVPGVQPDAQMARSGLGWAEGTAQSSGVASALVGGGSFSAAQRQQQAWLSIDPAWEQAAVVQRPQPNEPVTFADAPGFVRIRAESNR